MQDPSIAIRHDCARVLTHTALQDEKTSADYYFDSYAHFGKGVPLFEPETAVAAMRASSEV